MEKWTRADIRPIERGSEQDIEIEEGKRRNQEIRLVSAPKLHRFDPLAFQQKDPGQNHSQQESDREGSKIFWHRVFVRAATAKTIAHRGESLAAGNARGSDLQEMVITVVAYSAAPMGIIAFALIQWGLRSPSLHPMAADGAPESRDNSLATPQA